MKHEFTTKLEIHLNWEDKLRVLITGWINVVINHKCDNSPGKVESLSKMRAIGPLESFKTSTMKGLVPKQEHPRN